MENLGDVRISPAAKEFLEQLSERQIVNLVEAVEFYGNLAPETSLWLKKASAEEINLLSEGIKLVNSGKTVGRFSRRLIVYAIGMFILATQFGDSLKSMFASWKGLFK